MPDDPEFRVPFALDEYPDPPTTIPLFDGILVADDGLSGFDDSPENSFGIFDARLHEREAPPQEWIVFRFAGHVARRVRRARHSSHIQLWIDRIELVRLVTRGQMSEAVHMNEYVGNRNTPGPLTLADFEALPEDDNYRTELSRGWLMRESRPGGEHGCVSGNLHYLLRSFVSANGLGRVLIETGFRISEEPPTVRGPDVAFVATSRLPPEVPIGFWTLAPDLAIEVVSPSNRPNDIGLKVMDYLEAGTAEIWVVQPRTRTVVVHRATGDARIVREDETLSSELLPGLELSLKDVFEL